MLVITIVIELMVAFCNYIVTCLETLWEELLWHIRVIVITLDYRLLYSRLFLDLHGVTPITRCIRKRIGNLGLQHVHHLSHWSNHAIQAVSLWQFNFPFKHFNYLLDCKLDWSSRVSHIMNDHIKEYFSILKLDFELLYFLSVIFLQLSNLFFKHLILLLTDNDHL